MEVCMSFKWNVPIMDLLYIHGSIYNIYICFSALLISGFVFKAAEESSIPAPLKHQCLISAKWQRKDNWHVCTHIN